DRDRVRARARHAGDGPRGDRRACRSDRLGRCEVRFGLSRFRLAACRGTSEPRHRRDRMLEKVVYTSVLVSDQDGALEFYTNVVGVEKRVENPTPDGPRFLTVGVNGDDFQLVLWPGTPGQAEPAMGRPPASITIETDDCRRTAEELKSRGVEF